MSANVKQIYDIVNSVISQSTGASDLAVVDETDLIALGNSVLSSSTFTNDFINTLVDRIGKTIFSYRKYQNKFGGLLRDDFAMGAVLQKIKVEMPSAEQDESFGLTDGQSVDMQKVSKPSAKQKLFYAQTPYQFHITITRERLKDAFTSEGAMGSFISAIFGEVQNAIELALEDMGRNCVNNFIGEVVGSTREIKLLTEYNALSEPVGTLTASEAIRDEGFLKYASMRIKECSKLMTDMSKLYNDGSVMRHTPKNLQRMYVLAKFSLNLENNVLSDAFHKEFLELGDYQEVNYWQSAKSPFKIHVKRASDKTAKNVDNIIGVLFDYEALGIYKTDNWTSTAPFNSAGGYTNTYWHQMNMYFNDLSENGMIFTLN